MLTATLIAVFALFPTNPALLTVPIAEAASYQSSARVTWLHALGACENDQWPARRKILDTNGYYSYGPLMFQLATWLQAGKVYGFAITKENIYDQDLQEAVATAMLDDGGEGAWWTCAHKVQAELGAWPS